MMKIKNVTFDFSAPSQQGIHTDKSSSFDFQEVGLLSDCRNLQRLHEGIDHLDRTISFYRMEASNQEMDSASHSTYGLLYHGSRTEIV
ncbi:hypothetical protein TNCV_3275431 [Trichonephila clavipes]|nr:hypothetical protein TNCV_3275431 [Trichonephila clavipes]